jgi:hypothetical protein
MWVHFAILLRETYDSGIGIGIGVRTVFSHSGAAELISIGVLNSFSAGILVGPNIDIPTTHN